MMITMAIIMAMVITITERSDDNSDGDNRAE